MKELTRLQKRLGVAALGVFAFGGLVASATTMGGLTVGQLGANSTTVSSCDNDGVSMAYTTSYDTSSGKYKVTSATVSGINAACNGLTLGVTLTNASNAVLTSGSATVAGTSQAVSFGTSADADQVAGTAVVIS